MQNEDTSSANASFWNEPCGTHAATVLGVVDSSIESLKKFDDWYFDIYPYLDTHIPFGHLKGKNVLEIGLGYGTVSQKLAESGCNYTGLDIAKGPVDLVNHRLKQNNLPGKATNGSILEPIFEKESFDLIVTIGCLHHTGDLKKAIQQCHRLLKPGGTLIFMVYSAYSYRRWHTVFPLTFKYCLREVGGYRGVIGNADKKERAAYDANSKGESAPHTDFISLRSLKSLCGDFSQFSANRENIDTDVPFLSYTREKLLKTKIPKILGLDLYATAIK